jgi:C-terminal processing protease CtpA/Prc
LAESPDRLGVVCKPTPGGQGFTVVQVFRDTAGWNAQIEVGDRITAFNDEQLDDVRRLQYLTASHNGPVTLTIIPRGRTQAREAEITLDGPPVRIGIAWIRDEAEPAAAIVKKIYAGSAAEKAGLKVADRIYSIDGKSFATGDEFEDLLRAASGKVELAVERRGRVTPVTLTLDGK